VLTADIAVNAETRRDFAGRAALTRVKAGRRPGSAPRPALTADIAVNAGHPPDPPTRPALPGPSGRASMAPLT
jgi:hypothetical protein